MVNNGGDEKHKSYLGSSHLSLPHSIWHLCPRLCSSTFFIFRSFSTEAQSQHQSSKSFSFWIMPERLKLQKTRSGKMVSISRSLGVTCIIFGFFRSTGKIGC